MRAAGFTRVIAVVCTEDAGPLPRRDLVELVEQELDVLEALLVRRQRVWSYLCTDHDCCPPEGSAIIGPQRVGNDARDPIKELAPGGPRKVLKHIDRVLESGRIASGKFHHEIGACFDLECVIGPRGPLRPVERPIPERREASSPSVPVNQSTARL